VLFLPTRAFLPFGMVRQPIRRSPTQSFNSRVPELYSRFAELRYCLLIGFIRHGPLHADPPGDLGIRFIAPNQGIEKPLEHVLHRIPKSKLDLLH
jgi:hypothetical protein